MDNFRASISLGVFNINNSYKNQIIIAFGICATCMPIIGFIVGIKLAQSIESWVEYIGPALICSYGLYMIFFLPSNKEFVINNPWLVVILPILLSLDNLGAGIGIGLLGIDIISFAITLGIMASITSFIGLRIGRVMTAYLPSRSNFVYGCILILLASSLLFINL
jgi:manganese efflux pump family protein